MSIRASISPLQSDPSAHGRLHEFSEALPLSEPSKVLLELSFREVHVIVREGQDLLVETKSGKTFRVLNFYLEDEEASELYFLDDNDRLVAATFPQPMSNGLQPVEYMCSR